MTVAMDQQDVKICNYCKRPSEFISKGEPNNKSHLANGDIKNEIKPSHPRRLGLIRRIMPKYLHPRLERILYWRNIRETLIVFMAGIMLLTSISYYSLISVVSYLALAFLTSIFILKICSCIFGKSYLISNWPKCENLDEIVLRTLNNTLKMVADIRDIIFVKDLFRSMKYLFVLYIFTLIGEIMNGYTLLVVTFLALFTIPKSCELMWPKLVSFTKRIVRYCTSKIPLFEQED